ncbi:unnamed protein product [Peronospora farinosa]|uniref:Uncharacterized protein n=1 Tax=Peronospora farinosa TaxID=134698 RepID=A0AAV0UXW4_9STRA|nr:unnamed protein product [Peronospora farinosa]
MEEISWNHKWDFLLSWCQRISWHLRYVKGMIGDTPGQCFEGIQVQLPGFKCWNVGEYQEVCETLGLLAAVAHVDNNLWKKLLLQCTDLEIDNQEEGYEGTLMPRFQLAVIDNGPDNDYHLLRGIMKFCGTDQYISRSAEYKEVLAKVLAMNNKKSCTMLTEIEIPITVQLGSWLTSSSKDMLTYLRKLQETVRMIRMQWKEYINRDQSSLSAVFVLESITVDLRSCSISTELAEIVMSLARDGIRVSELALREDGLWRALASNGSIEEARVTVGKLMFGLFGGAKTTEWEDFGFETTSITGPLVAEYGYANQLASSFVHFDCEVMQKWVFERMCSAVVVNQTTKHLSLEMNDGESNDDDGDSVLRCWMWQWIIFACFSEKARLHSRLESLALHNVVITSEAVESMAAVLAAEGPEESLLGYSSCPSDAWIDLCIKAGSPIELLSVRREEPLCTDRWFTLDREITGVTQMIETDENDRASVLVPGFGRCRVKRTNLVYRELTRPSKSLAGITSLAIKFSEDPDPAILQGLLLLVGVSLTHLTLEFKDIYTNELEGIVATCPNLVELAVSTRTTEMRFCFRNSNFRNLTVHYEPHLSVRNVQGIAETLCDHKHPLTKCVRRLRVRLNKRADSDQCYAALLKLLEKNRTLEYLDIVAQRSQTTDHNAFQTHYNNFKTHHLESLPVTKTAFSMDCKVAFLSVLRAQAPPKLVNKKQKKTPSLLPVLDQNVLSSIFEYAAPHVIRRVYFREYNFFKTGFLYTPI